MRFNIETEETKILYIRVQTDGPMIFPLQVWCEDIYFASAAKSESKFNYRLQSEPALMDSIVETTINMAHGFGYKLVAEGVEDEATASLLQKMGCDYMQGYWLCLHIPLTELTQWLANQWSASES